MKKKNKMGILKFLMMFAMMFMLAGVLLPARSVYAADATETEEETQDITQDESQLQIYDEDGEVTDNVKAMTVLLMGGCLVIIIAVVVSVVSSVVSSVAAAVEDEEE